MNDSKINISNIRKAIPKIPGVIWSKHYRNASILIPLVKIGNDFHLLFEIRSESIKQGSEVCFPGGRYDKLKDKTERDTALRETIEELGIDETKIKILGQYHTLVHHIGMLVYTFVGMLKINSLDELSIDKKEVASVFTLPLSYFKNNHPSEYKLRLEAKPEIIDDNGNIVTLFPVKELGLPDRYLKPWSSDDHKVIVYKTPKAVIWGMTAKVVYDFVDSVT
ncbi:MAG TPA: CoA pyrophosphatase [Lentisphaeria bacterium]|nr:MAG: coenzyme A pyrophosphatase [Lentisphaerae bacterium GWF2_38_69]HBM15038.1 CoA pyrophosphatase [Lentisphaeria bacterium]